MYAPISGKIVEINEDLNDNPEFVNESPYEKAWMIVVDLLMHQKLNNLMTAEQYETMIKKTKYHDEGAFLGAF